MFKKTSRFTGEGGEGWQTQKLNSTLEYIGLYMQIFTIICFQNMQ